MHTLIDLRSIETPIGKLPSYDVSVEPLSTVETVVRLLEDRHELPGVLLVENNTCLGMVSRHKCYELLSGPYGGEVFLKRSIANLFKILNLPPTYLPSSMPIEQAVQFALNRPARQLYEPIVVQYDHSLPRLLDLHVLLLSQSHQLNHANRMVKRQLEVSQILSSVLELSQLMRIILQEMAKIIPFEKAGLLLKNGRSIELEFSELQAGSTTSSATTLPVHSVPSSKNSPGLFKSPVHSPLSWEMIASLPEIASWLSFPLVQNSEIIGVILITPTSPVEPNTEQYLLAQSFADQSAIAVQNALLYEEMEHMATLDPLTRLLNRRHFHKLALDYVEQARQQRKAISVAMLDIDRFKRVNDLYGHQVGDQVLEMVAIRCRENVRENDLVCRYGGEEILILFNNLVPAKTLQVIERLAERINQTPFLTENGLLHVSVSAGVAGFDSADHDLRLDRLVDQADQALYVSKASGRNRASLWTASLLTSAATGNLQPAAGWMNEVERFPDWIQRRGTHSLDAALLLLKHALSAVQDGVVITDMDGKIVWMNLAYADWHGYSAVHMLGKQIWSTSYSPGSLYSFSEIWRTVSTGQPWRGQITGNRAHDSACPQTITVLPVQLESNQVTHLVVIQPHLQNPAVNPTQLVDDRSFVLETWERILGLRDKETEGHTRRVVDMSVRLARAMNLTELTIENIRRGAVLHDIGKLRIPDRIINKPGPLNDEEWAEMKRHPEYAYQALSAVPQLTDVLEIPYCHHEKWDGSGYPRNLQGTEIPLAARIFAVVDVWDALLSDRPYRAAWSPDQVQAYLAEQSGAHFDPQVVATFLALLNPAA